MIKTGLYLGSTTSGSQCVVSYNICPFEVAHNNIAISLFFFITFTCLHNRSLMLQKTTVPLKALNSSSKVDKPSESDIEDSKNPVQSCSTAFPHGTFMLSVMIWNK